MGLKSFWLRYVLPYLIPWRDRRDLGLLLLSGFYFIVCIYIVALANAYADRVNPNHNKPPDTRYVSPDLLMDATNPWFERSSIPKDISDITVGISAFLLVGFAVTRGIAAATLLRRGLLIIGTLYLGRAPYMIFTEFPPPLRTCFTEINSNFGIDSLLLFSGRRVDCGDTFYSGHTIIFTSTSMAYWYHCRYWCITIPITLFNIFGALSLIFSAYHYTSDVLGSFMFTFLSWYLFHLTIEIDELGTQRWWGRLIRWWDYHGHLVLEVPEGRKTLMMAATGTG
ncbi:hypothetical protein HK104_005417, partial [Borealophlyctis nickersoniae]